MAFLKNLAKLAVEARISATATNFCQNPLFSIQMVEALGFDKAIVLEKATAMYKAQEGQYVATIETKILVGIDLEAKSIVGACLYAAATQIQTMPPRSSIERASLTLGT